MCGSWPFLHAGTVQSYNSLGVIATGKTQMMHNHASEIPGVLCVAVGLFYTQAQCNLTILWGHLTSLVNPSKWSDLGRFFGSSPATRCHQSRYPDLLTEGASDEAGRMVMKRLLQPLWTGPGVVAEFILRDSCPCP
jgi:hypothetical protein